jgi:hypothetical protein
MKMILAVCKLAGESVVKVNRMGAFNGHIGYWTLDDEVLHRRGISTVIPESLACVLVVIFYAVSLKMTSSGMVWVNSELIWSGRRRKMRIARGTLVKCRKRVRLIRSLRLE